MYETPEQYLEIVKREVRKLEDICHCRIFDGENNFCPRCGEYGTWDIETKGFVDERMALQDMRHQEMQLTVKW